MPFSNPIAMLKKLDEWSSRDTDALFDSMDQAGKGLPPIGLPGLAGLVLRGPKASQNAKTIFKQMMMRLAEKGFEGKALKDLDPREVAIEFARAKYPKLTKVPAQYVKNEGTGARVAANTLGEFDPSTNIVRVFPTGRGLSEKASPYLKISHATDTIVHETQHASRQQRGIAKQKLLDELADYPIGKAIIKGYPHAFVPKPLGLPYALLTKSKGYWRNPFEVEARLAGATGKDAFQTLFNEIEELDTPSSTIFDNIIKRK